LTIQAFAPDGAEITFFSAADPVQPVSQGWLRASQRRLDEDLSSDGQPVHTHTVSEPLVPGAIYNVDVACWATSLRLPAGAALALTIRGKDFDRDGERSLFTHDDPADRPPEIFGGSCSLYTGGENNSHIVLPVIPRR
jgi:hypothetical protein